MSQHALAVVVVFICAALGIWIAESLLGRVTDPVRLVLVSAAIAIVSVAILAIFRSTRS